MPSRKFSSLPVGQEYRLLQLSPSKERFHMKKVFCIAHFSLLFQIFIVLVCITIPAQAQIMTPVQALTILSGYIQAPDTALNLPQITSIDKNDHTHYLFYGNQGGTYSIDATTAEKHIGYSGVSAADMRAQTPQNHLAASSLQQYASSFVAQHFPNYVNNMFQIVAPSVDLLDDGDEYYVDFNSLSASGAMLPIHATVIVEEDTGKIKAYDEYSTSVTINTTPNISQSQAIQIGQNWITQNMSTDPVAGQFQTDLGGSSPIKFYVNVDSLMNQSLLYKICYTTTVLNIDAQTGAIIGQDFYAGVTSKITKKGSKNYRDQEILYNMCLKPGGESLNRAAILTEDQTYIWAGYMNTVGIQMENSNSAVIMRCGEKRMKLSFSKTSKPNNRIAWRRKDGIYIPLAAIHSMTNTFIKNSATREISIYLTQK